MRKPNSTHMYMFSSSMQPLLHSPSHSPVMCLCRCHFVVYCPLSKHYLSPWRNRTKRQSPRPHNTTQRSSAYLHIDTVSEAHCACSLCCSAVSCCVVVVIVFLCDRGIGAFVTCYQTGWQKSSWMKGIWARALRGCAWRGQYAIYPSLWHTYLTKAEHALLMRWTPFCHSTTTYGNCWAQCAKQTVWYWQVISTAKFTRLHGQIVHDNTPRWRAAMKSESWT